jgi:divalent metal cation (Fe/Co/Zn/Cd) transporter
VGVCQGPPPNQGVAWYKLRVGRRIQSATLISDGRHSWLDAFSSFGDPIGPIAVAAGAKWGDPVAGFAATLFIAHVSYEVTKDILGHLMDSVDPESVFAAERAAVGVDGFQHTHIRARWMGRTLLVETQGFMSADASIADGEALGHEVELAMLGAVPEARCVVWSPRGLPSTTLDVIRNCIRLAGCARSPDSWREFSGSGDRLRFFANTFRFGTGRP